ncbi:hypothetical protein [Congzhengia minquanensis]|uniref:Uncharacterized protein n=1 Tax=Congzhengia minquanensis TaxID=2763657 RepID=A0A926DMT8_9FIRM|nr:hypothetical protein [Congzhengia minquanensis]MBC8540853.1 hypothetical protein [Congzhengia minquanensis]
MSKKPCKTYVDVLAKFDCAGNVIPMRIKWEDGRIFLIDNVIDIRRAASIKGGGLGIRYTVVINGKRTYIWRDDDTWFVERKYLYI